MKNNRPIGVFDSGFGGISVLNQLMEVLPHEQFIYIADSAWCPYGFKSFGLIRDRTRSITEYFIEKQVKLIVVACNTATAVAIDFLREQYPDLIFVGMEPAIKPAAKLTQTNAVGVLATRNTFNGQLFKETREKYASHINVIIQEGEGLVELVENNKSTSPEAYHLIKKYTSPMLDANADYLVLGCTHYPFLKETIAKVVPSLSIIDPAIAVAKHAGFLLSETNMLKVTGDLHIEFLTTGESNRLSEFISLFVSGSWNCTSIAL